jgi:hypothetical protein
MSTGSTATNTEIEQMQTVLDAWQSQATTAHEQLKITSGNLKALTVTHHKVLNDLEKGEHPPFPSPLPPTHHASNPLPNSQIGERRNEIPA